MGNPRRLALQERLLTMLATAIFVLAVYGLANAIGTLKVGELVRGTCAVPKRLGRLPFFGKMFFCPACLSFWIGMAASVWILSPAAQVVDVWWKAMLLDGLAASAVSWVLYCLTEKLALGTNM